MKKATNKLGKTTRSHYLKALSKPLRKEVSELEMLLKNHGYFFWDTWNSYEHGTTLSYIKNRLRGVKLVFEFYVDNCGGPSFVVGTMRAFFKLFPNDHHWGPDLHAEISVILKRDLVHFKEFQRRLINIVASQKSISTEER